MHQDGRRRHGGHALLSDASENSSPSSSDTSDTKGKGTCVLCKGKHFLDTCKAFLSKSLSDKKQFLKEQCLCYGCLQKGHVSKRCRHRIKCSMCSKLHQSSLHGDTRRQGQLEQNGSQGVEAAAINHETSTHNVSSHIEDITQNGEAFLGSTGEGSKCSMIVPVYLSHCDTPERGY